MPAVVMKVTKAEKHPNADTLYVYEMLSAENKPTQIVANQTNIYTPGDHAIVATPGTQLKEGDTYIQETKVRGVVSSGMALGKTDAPVGTSFTDELCVPVFCMKWPDIESLFNVRKSLKDLGTSRAVHYASKIKLDGTNAAVQVLPSGQLVVQSRDTIITPEKDNAGFAAWVKKNSDYFTSLASDHLVVIFGEWCGQGIQKRCSISKIDRKVFAVFAVQHGESFDVNPRTIKESLGCKIVDDSLMGRQLPGMENKTIHPDVFVIPFYKHLIMDYTNLESLQNQADLLNQWVADIEECDPFVRDTFGVPGLGEGLVFYPLCSYANLSDNLRLAQGNEICRNTQMLISRAEYTELVFKAKGEAHKVVQTKASVQVDPEVAKNIDEFVSLFCTEARLEQIANKIGDFDMKKTGQFLKLFGDDVIKESKAELEASKMEWKAVASAVSNKARMWWTAKVNKI